MGHATNTENNERERERKKNDVYVHSHSSLFDELTQAKTEAVNHGLCCHAMHVPW
jgi:hypothetical protein